MKQTIDATTFIGKIVSVKIDRPLGSRHPIHGFIYPINYGFVPDTISGDGEELDAYILGIFEPLREFKGKCVAVIRRKNDDDDKIVVMPCKKKYNNDQILALTEFQERFFASTIIRIP
jgi:inorganic pyrophosphatase